jgi:ribosomal protein L7/L12
MEYVNVATQLAERFDLIEDEVSTFLSNNAIFNKSAASMGKIQAIKEFKRVTGYGLKDSKEAVEAIMTMTQNTDIPLNNANRIIDLQQKEIDMLRSRVDTLHQRLNSIIEMSDADTLRAIVRDLI